MAGVIAGTGQPLLHRLKAGGVGMEIILPMWLAMALLALVLIPLLVRIWILLQREKD